MLFNKDGILKLDEIVVNTPSWKKMIADGIISEEEIAEQSAEVTQLLRHIEETFSEEQCQCVEKLLAEASVLLTAYHEYTSQQI